MRRFVLNLIVLCLLAGIQLGFAATVPTADRPRLDLSGITITPHIRSAALRYEHEPSEDLGARVELYLKNPLTNAPSKKTTFFCNAIHIDEQEPRHLLDNGAWAWQDTPNLWNEKEVSVPPSCVVIYRFNTKSNTWSLGKSFTMKLTDWENITRKEIPVKIAPQGVWISSVTFPCTNATQNPDSIIAHIENQSATSIKVINMRFYLAGTNDYWRVYFPQPLNTNIETWPKEGGILASDKGIVRVKTGPLPLSNCAIQFILADEKGNQFPLWANLKIKRDYFILGAGAIADGRTSTNIFTYEPYLKLLSRLHVNAAHYVYAPAYYEKSGPAGFYTNYPLNRIGKFDPVASFDTQSQLSSIAMGDFLGEPQNEQAGLARFPQAVQQSLVPYSMSPIPSTLHFTDESSWNLFAGLSDYPSFSAYRVACPSADDWLSYSRWDGKPINWGAPLETVGYMARVLKEIHRPRQIAAWCQGPFSGWEVRDGRRRTTPTPDEIRLQAYHLLASRVTSIFWKQLDPKSLVQNRDTIQELNRIGREIRMMEPFIMEGDAYRWEEVKKQDGKLDWLLASITSPNAALLFALDEAYEPDRSARVFEWKSKRDVIFAFALPSHLRRVWDVLRIDADGVFPAQYYTIDNGVKIVDKQSKTAIYIATPSPQLKAQLEARYRDLLQAEAALDFDPVSRSKDFDLLKQVVQPK